MIYTAYQQLEKTIKSQEIMNILFSMADMTGFDNTCDTLKCGQADKEVKKVAVTMFPTVDVIKQAAEWSTDLLIVHEPLYYNHLDKEITPRELAFLMEERICINHLRIAGNTDSPCRVLSGKFGSPGGVGRELRNEKSEIILVGEVCEWADCEYARMPPL